ncbi:trypsin inhibitor-like [Galleria mellonella]|uniref:Trypsin inhibitor-like n=1 Tax=Galleria mellonella TaxID=7137 RepID=A0ABM3MRR9_GALME|nr:trypsin inhibitor-like [Galleria mellonella]
MKVLVAVFVLVAVLSLSYGQPDRCKAPIDDRVCFGFRGYYAYDLPNNKCIELRFGGCYEGPNDFKSKAECESTCVKK